MRLFVRALCVSALLGLAGCGDDGATVTDPTKLAPLTEEQKAAIAKNDALIADEEVTSGGRLPKPDPDAVGKKKR